MNRIRSCDHRAKGWDNVISFENRELFEDPLTDLLRSGARQLIALGVEAELDELMAKYAGQHTETGRQAVVRSGYHRQRQIQTGIGAVTVKIPKVRSTTGEPVTFRSWLIPPYVRTDAHAGGVCAMAVSERDQQR